MDSKYLSLIRQLAQGLRYETANTLIGLEVGFSDASMVVDSPLAIVQNQLPQLSLAIPMDVDLTNRNAVFRKYDFFDIWYRELSRDITSVPLGGTQLLMKLGFVHSLVNLDEIDALFGIDEDDEDDQITCLETLRDEIQENELYLLLWLVNTKTPVSIPGHTLGLLPEFAGFPNKLSIADACLTNAPFCWFNKHFYM